MRGINSAFKESANMSVKMFSLSIKRLLPMPLMTVPDNPKNPFSKLPNSKMPRTSGLMTNDLPAIIKISSGNKTIKKPMANWMSVTSATQ